MKIISCDSRRVRLFVPGMIVLSLGSYAACKYYEARCFRPYLGEIGKILNAKDGCSGDLSPFAEEIIITVRQPEYFKNRLLFF